MGKSKERRIRARHSRLSKIADQNPVDFMREWAKRVDSWTQFALESSNRLKYREVIEMIYSELHSLGENAACIAMEYTQRRVSSLAEQVRYAPRNLYKLNNYEAIIKTYSMHKGSRIPGGTNGI